MGETGFGGHSGQRRRKKKLFFPATFSFFFFSFFPSSFFFFFFFHSAAWSPWLPLRPGESHSSFPHSPLPLVTFSHMYLLSRNAMGESSQCGVVCGERKVFPLVRWTEKPMACGRMDGTIGDRALCSIPPHTVQPWMELTCLFLVFFFLPLATPSFLSFFSFISL